MCKQEWKFESFYQATMAYIAAYPACAAANRHGPNTLPFSRSSVELIQKIIQYSDEAGIQNLIVPSDRTFRAWFLPSTRASDNYGLIPLKRVMQQRCGSIENVDEHYNNALHKYWTLSKSSIFKRVPFKRRFPFGFESRPNLKFKNMFESMTHGFLFEKISPWLGNHLSSPHARATNDR